MARTKRGTDLDSRNKRLELLCSRDYSDTLAPGCYIIYRRAAGKGGVWRARWYDSQTRKMQRTTLGGADDYVDADGVRILNWDQATDKAGKWFGRCGRLAHLEATGEVISDKPLTVAEAIAAYMEDIERRGRPVGTVESFARTRILPELGNVEVEKLTRKKVADWHMALAASPRWKTGRKTSEKREEWDEKPTPDQKRARRNTANRVLAILKRALNLAVEMGTYGGATPWREVRPFQAVKACRVRFLSQAEQIRLVNACSPEFRSLVMAALYTGSRYAPLTRLQVKDFNPEAGTLFIARDKGRGKDTFRHIVLSPEAIEWFKAMVAGKGPEDLILQRATTHRTTREGETWLHSDQKAAMKRACKIAKLDPVTFHELRHTYASGLVNAGVPLAYVAEQLGHSNTRMVEEFYGHLCPSAKAESIRKLAPGLMPKDPKAPKVQELKVSG